MDSLDSGDVILFRKPWYKQLVRAPRSDAHLPRRPRQPHAPSPWPPQLWGAVTTLLRQEVAHSMFDHMGVVIVDEKGQALVLECTCSGIKVRPAHRPPLPLRLRLRPVAAPSPLDTRLATDDSSVRTTSGFFAPARWRSRHGGCGQRCVRATGLWGQSGGKATAAGPRKGLCRTVPVAAHPLALTPCQRTPKMRVRLLEWAKRAQGHAYPFHVDELRAPLMPDSARSVEDSLQHMAHPAAGECCLGV